MPHDPAITQYKDRIPYVDDVIRDGGRPGCEYAYVLGDNIGYYNENEPDTPWTPVPGAPVLTIEGPKGRVDNVMVLVRGKPIKGADARNGVRIWLVDPDIHTRTGIAGASPAEPVPQDAA